MHELSLMEALRDLALAQAQRFGGGRIVAIHLRLGSLAGVDGEALQLAARVVLQGSAAAGARLQLEWVPARCRCPACGLCFEAQAGVCECPACGAISRELLQGRELELVALDLEDGPQGGGSGSSMAPL